MTSARPSGRSSACRAASSRRTSRSWTSGWSRTRAADGYERWLRLDEGVAGQSWATGAQEAFVSRPASVVVVHRTWSGGPLRVRVTSEHPLDRPTGDGSRWSTTLRLPSDAPPDYVAGAQVVRDRSPGTSITAAVAVEVVTDGVAVAGPDGLVLRDASWVTVVVATATDYVDATTPVHGDADALRAQAATTASTAAARGASALRDEHVADHARLFDRVALDLGKTPASRAAHRRAPPSARGRRTRSRAGRARVPPRAVPADRRVTARDAAHDSAGDLERRGAAAVVVQLHDQHQHRDELLAGAEHQPRGVPRAAPALGRRAGHVGHAHGRRAVRAARLGRPPQLRRVGLRRVRGRRHRRPVVGVLAVRRRLARPAPGRPPRLHRGPPRPVRAARRRAVRPRLAGRAPRRDARHPPVDVPGEHLRRPGRPARLGDDVDHRGPGDGARPAGERRPARRTSGPAGRGVGGARRGCPRNASHPTAGWRSGATTSRTSSRSTATRATSSACTRGRRSTRTRRRTSPEPPWPRSTRAAPTRPAGRWRGASTCAPACATRRVPRRWSTRSCDPRGRAPASTATSSAPTRPSRSTGTSASPRASPSSCSSRTARSVRCGSSTSCRPSRRPGRPGPCAGCGRAAGSSVDLAWDRHTLTAARLVADRDTTVLLRHDGTTERLDLRAGEAWSLTR